MIQRNARHFLLFLSHGRTIHSSLMQERKIHSVFVFACDVHSKGMSCLSAFVAPKGKEEQLLYSSACSLEYFSWIHRCHPLCPEDIFFSAFCTLQEQKRGLTTSAQCLCCISKKLFFKEQRFSQLNVH